MMSLMFSVISDVWTHTCVSLALYRRGDGHYMSAILGDGFDWQLVLTQWSLLKYGNRLEGRGRSAALNDPIGWAYRVSDARNWLYLH